MTDAVQLALHEIADTFLARFPASRPGQRTVGREAEFPVVHPDGSAADVAALWPHLVESGRYEVKRERDLIVGLEGERYSYSLEVGWGTVEAILSPTADLVELKALHEEATSHLLRAAEAAGVLVLGYGIQPRTPATPALLAPKQRYKALLDVIGPPWLWFTLTASDQLHVSITRDEFAAMTNLGNLLSPVLIALCANSPVYQGQPSGFASAREGRMGEIHAEAARHGMTARAVTDAADFVALMARHPYLVRRVDGLLLPYQGRFDEWLDSAFDQDPAARFDAYLLHEHYVWNSARPRSAHGTIELRAACQQPFSEHMAAAALGLGIIEGAPALARYVVERLGPDPWPAMRTWHREVVARGLAAEEPAPGFLEGVLGRCRDALAARGRGEEALLRPLEDRLQKRMNPAQEAEAAFEAGGMEALVEHTRAR